MAESDKTSLTQVDSGATPVTDHQSTFIFIDGFSGVVEANGVVRLRLTRTRLRDSGSAVQEVAAHLAMSGSTLVNVHKALGRLIDEMREAGRFTIVEESSDDG